MSETPVRLYIVHYDQCDPRKCTSKKMEKFGLAQLRKHISKVPRRAIVLDPFADRVLSEEDAPEIERNGLVVIDCSWAKTDGVFKRPMRNGRRLPKLLAGNGVNYGKWERLSSAEAIAAALAICGHREQADLVLSKFRWGHNFFELNRRFFGE